MLISWGSLQIIPRNEKGKKKNNNQKKVFFDCFQHIHICLDGLSSLSRQGLGYKRWNYNVIAVLIAFYRGGAVPPSLKDCRPPSCWGFCGVFHEELQVLLVRQRCWRGTPACVPVARTSSKQRCDFTFRASTQLWRSDKGRVRSRSSSNNQRLPWISEDSLSLHPGAMNTFPHAVLKRSHLSAKLP